MNLSKERMDQITRLVEGGFPLKADEVEDLHGMNYHLYCLCDTYQVMKIRAENEVEILKAENEKLKAENRELKDVKLGLSWAFGELKIDAENLRKDAERYRWLRSRDLDTISDGGVFAGMTPQNMVLNEETLDEAVDSAMKLPLLIITPLNPA
jgi:hypothetical protein